MNNDRQSGLDGLRGFAAISVLLSHSGFDVTHVINNSWVDFIYRTLAVGPNSVQILFVLCGFFMASVYPEVKDTYGFLQKRYFRIFPIFFVVCGYYFVLRIFPGITNIKYYQLLLILMAGVFRLIWEILRRLRLTMVGNYVFGGFFAIQILLVLINAFFSQRIYLGQITGNLREGLMFLSNFTVTNPFGTNIHSLSGVFWSLVPEIYFYLLYPLVMIPIIKLTTNKSWWLKLGIMLLMIKLIMDLDIASFAFNSLHGMQIGRASGFLVGSILGAIYAKNSIGWGKIKKATNGWKMNLLAGGLMVFFQYLDWSFRHNSDYQIMNLYYLGSSMVIGLVIACSIQKDTWLNKILSNKALVKVGLVSYSLYLTHPIAIEFSRDVLNSVGVVNFSQTTSGIIYLLTMVGWAFIFALLLFKLVENIYFIAKNDPIDNLNSWAINKFKVGVNFIYRQKLALSALIISFIYLGSTVPSIFIINHPQKYSGSVNFKDVSLLNSKISQSFVSGYNNLSAIAVQLRYGLEAQRTIDSNIPPAKLIFKLVNSDTKQILFESERSAYQIEGIPFFPFGIPTITNSLGKRYVAELELVGGSSTDQIYYDLANPNIVSYYSMNKNDIKQHPLSLIINRVLFLITNHNYIYAISLLIIFKLSKRFDNKLAATQPL